MILCFDKDKKESLLNGHDRAAESAEELKVLLDPRFSIANATLSALTRDAQTVFTIADQAIAGKNVSAEELAQLKEAAMHVSDANLYSACKQELERGGDEYTLDQFRHDAQNKVLVIQSACSRSATHIRNAVRSEYPELYAEIFVHPQAVGQIAR